MELIKNAIGTAKPQIVSKYGKNGTDVNIFSHTETDEYGTELYVYDIYRFENETFENDIVALIRIKYSVSDELAILRQRDTKADEFKEYYDYVEWCKKQIDN